jgi:hypothetical protein
MEGCGFDGETFWVAKRNMGNLKQIVDEATELLEVMKC